MDPAAKKEKVPEEILKDLTDEQRAAVTHRDGPLIVVAGPGSGKTRVITRRVAWLIANGVEPSSILAITFTNKAADEMRRRIDDLVGAASGVYMSTFHSFCARMLRKYGPPERKPSFSIYDEDDQRTCVKRILQDLKLEEQTFRPGEMLARISDAKNRLVSVDDFESGATGYRDNLVAKVYRRYEETLAQFNALDFDDLLVYMVRLLETREDIREELRDRFRYVLVDEYQDTNRPQYLLAKLLVGENGNICVVGDPDQSIYRWRGAEIRNILEFEQDYPGAREVRLERNYRSTKRILAAAQALIENNVGRREKKIFTENEAGEPIRVMRCLSDDDEARAVGGAVQEAIAEGVPLSEIAIFYRTAALSRKFEEELRRRGVRHQVIGAVPFFQRKEVKDLLSYVRILANPLDEQQLRRAASLTEGFGSSTLKRIEEFADDRGLPLLHAMEAVGEIEAVKARERKAVERLLKLLDELRTLATGSVGPMLKHIVEETGMRRAFTASKDPQDWSRAENLEALVNEGYDFDDREGGDYRAFLDRVALLSSTDQDKEAEGAVKLMTLHAAKGLEFDEVFIVGVDEGTLPLEREQEIADVEEERRLFYVGLTRARKRVTVTTVRVRRTYGQDKTARPSSFLFEIPREVCEQEGALEEGFDRPEPLRPFAAARGPAPAPASPARPAPRFSPATYAAPAIRAVATQELVAGDRVSHAVFGKGEVLEVMGTGVATRVTVDFDVAGKKTLVLHYANLQRI